MPSAIPYVRFSSSKQQHGSSLDRQNEAIGKWLIAHQEFTLSGLKFEDLGHSGYSGKHLENGFGKLLAAVESQAIKAGDVVLIEAIDRAGRLPPDQMLHILTGITTAGVSLVSLDDGSVYDNNPHRANNLFLLVAKVQQAWQYSDALSRRITASYKARRTNAANGVAVKRSTPVWLDKDGALIPDLVPIVVQAFEDYAAGLGERRIHQRIKDQHPALAKLNPSTIKRWLTNTTAIGYWGDIPEANPAVVSKELFYRVQRVISSRGRKRSAPSQHYLTGIVKCGICGSNFVYKALSKSPHVMGCGRRARLGNDGCTNKTNWPVLLIDYVRCITYGTAVGRSLAQSTSTAAEKQRIELEGTVEATTKRISRLVALLATHDIPEVKTELKETVNQRTELQAQLAALVTAPASSDFNDALGWGEVFLDDDKLKLNAMLQSVGYTLTCTGNTLTTDEPIYETPGPHSFVYKGYDRKKDSYVLTDGYEGHYFPLPRPERDAQEITDYLGTAIN
jgi:DNA invertase Pin-like site-specific DNA recombinase